MFDVWTGSNTIALPRWSTLHTVNARAQVISLAGGFLSWHVPVKKWDVYKSLEGEALHSFFEGISYFKWIYTVCRIDVFLWNLSRTFTDRFLLIYSLWVFSWKHRSSEVFFFWRTPTKAWSNPNETILCWQLKHLFTTTDNVKHYQ